jgi:hypothetical protein
VSLLLTQGLDGRYRGSMLVFAGALTCSRDVLRRLSLRGHENHCCLIESAPISEAVRAKVCRGNAERLLRL